MKRQGFGWVRAGAIRAAILLAAVILGGPTVRGAGGDLLWQDQVDRAGRNDSAQHAIVTEGPVFVGGSVATSGGDADFLVRAYDGASGTLTWEDQSDGQGGGDVAFWLAAAGGMLFATGFTSADPSCVWFDNGGCDLHVRAFNALTGALVWDDQVDHAGGPDFGANVAADAARVVVVGDGENVGGDTAFLVRAYDAATGALLWNDQIDGPGGDDNGRAVALRGRRLVVAGISATPTAPCDVSAGTGNCDFFVRAYDAANGTVIWEDRLDIAGGTDQAFDVALHGPLVIAAGLVAADATCNPRTLTGDCDFLVRAYHGATGTLLWEDRFDNGGGMDVANDLAASGRLLVVTGFTEATPGDLDLFVKAYDLPSGAPLWQDSAANPGGPDFGWSVALRGGKAYVGGSRGSVASSDDLLVRSYDGGTGQLLWEDVHDLAGGSDFAFVVGAGGGRVSAAGYVTTPAGHTDLVVRTYDAGN